MISTGSLDTVQVHVDDLTRSQFRQENVGVGGLDNPVAREILLLSPNRLKDKIPRINMCVIVKDLWIVFVPTRVRVLGTFRPEFHDNRVVICRVGSTAWVTFAWWLAPVQPIEALE